MRRYNYITEWNRVHGDNVRRAATRLEKKGLHVTVLPHKTSMSLARPSEMSWADFKSAIRSELRHRRASVLIFSKATGNSFLCRNFGNRPGKFELVE